MFASCPYSDMNYKYRICLFGIGCKRVGFRLLNSRADLTNTAILQVCKQGSPFLLW